MSRYQAKTRTTGENRATREEAQARRMHRRHQNHGHSGTTSAPSIFTLRW